MSPDGAHYAYGSGAAQGPNELHIVDVRTGIVFIDSLRTWLYVDEPAPTINAFRVLRLYLLSAGRAVHVMDSKWDLGSRFAGACR